MPDAVTVVRSFDLPRPPAWAWEAFVRLAWDGGAGFGPKPVVVDGGDRHGIGRRRHIPIPGRRPLVEQIDEGAHPHWLSYRVVDPGWPTFPVQWHRGTIAFDATNDGATTLTWTVEFVPLPRGRWIAVTLTRLVMRRYARCLIDAARGENPTSDPTNR